VEGERKVSWNLAPVFGAVLAHLTPYMVLNTENIVILPSSNLGAAFFVASFESTISGASKVVLTTLNTLCGVFLNAAF